MGSQWDKLRDVLSNILSTQYAGAGEDGAGVQRLKKPEMEGREGLPVSGLRKGPGPFCGIIYCDAMLSAE